MRVPQAVRGKHIEKADGQVAPKSKLGFLAVSGDFARDPDEIWTALNPKGTPTPSDIDPACRASGALVARTLPGRGMAVMRLRYRQEEALDESASRSFPLAQILMFEGVEYWRDVPLGLFAWAWAELMTHELVMGAPETLPPFEVSLEPPQRHVVTRMVKTGDPANQMFRTTLDVAMDITPGPVSLPVNPDDATENDDPHYGEWVTTLDVMALAARLSRTRQGEGHVDMPINVAIGLNPERARIGLCFSAAVKPTMRPAPSDSSRIAAFETDIKTWTSSAEVNGQEAEIRSVSGRVIGVDPIPFGWGQLARKRDVT